MGCCLLCSELQALSIVQRAYAAERALDTLRLVASDVLVGLTYGYLDYDGRPITSVEHLIFETAGKPFRRRVVWRAALSLHQSHQSMLITNRYPSLPAIMISTLCMEQR